MKYFQRCAALALALTVVLGALAIPSHAAQQYVSTGSFWSAVGRGLTPIGRKLLFFWNDSVCAASKDARHSGYLDFTMAGRDGDKTYYAKCQYCGEHFKLTEDDIKNQYNDYVNSLPGTSANKDGYFIPLVVQSVDTSHYTGDSYMIVGGEGTNKISFTASSAPGTSTRFYFASCSAPVTGDYAFCLAPGSTRGLRVCCPLTKTGNYRFGGAYYILPGMDMYPSNYSYSPYISKSAGSAICSDGDYFYIKSGSERSVSLAFYLYCKPAVLPDFVTDIDSRPTFGDGSIGIIGDNGKITQVNGNQIFDESTNLVYNPVTNTTVEVSNWTYDYASRTYYLTLGNGSTQEIRYGDENITIVEGDTIYNVYYVVPTNPDSCDHTYTTTVTTAPTCTVGGLDTYTCSKCGYSYTQKTPAAGHTWTVKQSVQTEYDESGNIVTQGYTIYKCSVCSEEYKDTDGTGPPSKPSTGSGDDDDGIIVGTLKKLISGLFKLISGIIGGIVDGLLTLISTAVDKLTQVVNLFGTFGEALSVLWSWLPTDVVAVLVAGVTVVVFAAVLKIFVK